VLLEATPRDVNVDTLREHILACGGVLDIHDLHVWTITSGVNVISAHVVMKRGPIQAPSSTIWGPACAATSTSSIRPSSSRPTTASVSRAERIREWELAALAPTPRAEPVEVEGGMVDGKVVMPADRRKHRRDHIFRDIVDALTVRAHEMVVMLGIAGDIRRDVPVSLEAARHPILDLLLERAVHRGAADRGMRSSDALVELLRRERALRRSQGLGHDHSLGRAPPAPAARRVSIDAVLIEARIERGTLFDTESHLQ